MKDNVKELSEAQLWRKADQCSEMASLAYSENDPKDAAKYLALEKACMEELRERRE